MDNSEKKELINEMAKAALQVQNLHGAGIINVSNEYGGKPSILLRTEAFLSLFPEFESGAWNVRGDEDEVEWRQLTYRATLVTFRTIQYKEEAQS